MDVGTHCIIERLKNAVMMYKTVNVICSENTRCLLELIFAMSSPGLLAADTSKLQVPSTSTMGNWTFSMIKKALGSSESVPSQGGSQQSFESIDNDEEGHEAGLETDW